jgi:hypothetical protein
MVSPWGCAMTSWKRERDRLVEQTLAFMQSVAGKRGPHSLSAPPASATSQVGSAPGSTSRLFSPPAPGRPSLKSERDEIMQRVAAFRAHQGKLIREREAYYLEVQAKIRTVMSGDSHAGRT